MLIVMGKGHRKFQLCSRKNYERKKYRISPIVTSLQVEVSTLTVSIPRALLPSTSLVSLPISAFRDAPLTSAAVLRTRLLQLNALPSGLHSHLYQLLLCYKYNLLISFVEWKEHFESDVFYLYRLCSKSDEISIDFSVTVKEDLTYTISFKGAVIDVQKFLTNASLSSTVTSGE